MTAPKGVLRNAEQTRIENLSAEQIFAILDDPQHKTMMPEPDYRSHLRKGLNVLLLPMKLEHLSESQVLHIIDAYRIELTDSERWPLTSRLLLRMSKLSTDELFAFIRCNSYRDENIKILDELMRRRRRLSTTQLLKCVLLRLFPSSSCF